MAHSHVGQRGVAYRAAVSTWPVALPYRHLGEYLTEPKALSARATAGFLERAETGTLRFVDGYLDDVRTHLDVMRRRVAA